MLERDGHRCVRCGVDVRTVAAYSLQHRRPRGMGGTVRPDTNLPANLVTACGTGTTGCHGQVMEADRIEARFWGWLIWQTADPTERPVWVHGRGWVLLDNEGGWTSVGDPHEPSVRHDH